jgi:catechol 2,3-dioxygenase-like lactoylglutathione lyase family enzyme
MTADIIAGAVIYAADLDRLAAFYTAVLGFQPRTRDPEHVVLESNSIQLVFLHGDTVSADPSTAGATPLPRRSAAAIKPVFLVPSIAKARAGAEEFGGLVNAARHEWRFGAYLVCDGLDPEGNVIQVRERLRDEAPLASG